MKNLLFLVVWLVGYLPAFTQNYKIITYNIKYDNPGDTLNNWVDRKEEIVKLISYYNPDIFGTQEGLKHQVDYLRSNLVGYDFYNAGRDDGKDKGESTAIFYKNDFFDLLEKSTFWLSETPGIASKGWDAALPRICSYVLLKSKENETQFYVYNTHFDHMGEMARINSAKLMLEKIEEINSRHLPLILMGDFNSSPDAKPITIITTTMLDARNLSVDKPFGPNFTFNGFEFGSTSFDRIDYIFFSKNDFQHVKYAVSDHSFDQKYPSDHFPVIVEFTILHEH